MPLSGRCGVSDMGLLSFMKNGDSRRSLKKLDKMANEVERLEPKYKAMTDSELQSQTQVLKDRLKKGETLDDILYDAFAALREASSRVLGMRHFHVQIIGGICLFQGRIAEMKTGEGKTLVATLPAYLEALSGKGVHIVTVNDYSCPPRRRVDGQSAPLHGAYGGRRGAGHGGRR